MERIKPNFIRCLWIVIILFHPALPRLWSLDPDQPLDKYLLDRWGSSEGLPSNTIHSIIQTPDGFLWLATFNGLVRFDGIKFSNIPFTKEEDISPRGYTEPITLLVNREGDLWIGSTTGLTRFRNGRFKTFTTADGLSGKSIRCLAVDMKNNLWISFMTGYLDRFSREKFTPFNTSNGLEGDKISAIVEDHRGNLLFASREKGIFSFREGRFSRYPVHGLDNRSIITMYQDHNEDLWIGTTEGLVQVNEKGTARYGSSQGLSHEYITVITEDSELNLWIGTLRGLNRLKRKDDRSASFESILDRAVIFCLYEDREKSLWIGTDGSGLKRLKDSKFTSFGANQALQEETILSIFRNPGGDTWLGSLGGKLFLFRENRLIETAAPPGLSGTGISAIAEDSKGNLWLGTTGRGIFQKKDKTFVPVTSGQGLTGSVVISIFKDSRDNLWCCTFTGVTIFRNPGGGIETFNAREGLSGKAAHNVCEDKAGNIWISADRGITFLTGGKTTKQYIRYYLEGVPAVSIYEDPSPPKGEDQVSWISTIDAGLKRLNPGDGTVFSYTAARGMTTNCIYQFFEERGNFWLMSNNGILRVSKNKLNLLAKGGPGEIDCISFGTEEGMQSSEFHNELSRHSALQTKDGELWFVTKKGISIVKPGKIRVNKEPPPVVIETALFDGISFNLTRDNETYRFKGIKRVEFRFTAPSFLSPEKIKFKYQLVLHRGSTSAQNLTQRAIKNFVGVQGAPRRGEPIRDGFVAEDVSDNSTPTSNLRLSPLAEKSPLAAGGKERVACYQDLAPGTYTFNVTACNAEGIWNPKGTFITFTLEPFFYQTTGFKIAVAILFIILGTAFILIYKKKRQKEKKGKVGHEPEPHPETNEINEKLLPGVQGAPRRGEPIRGGFAAEDVFDNSTRTSNLHLSPLAEKSPPGRRRQINEDSEEKLKYKSSNLTPEFAVECEKKLKHLMEVEKLYRDEEISLQSLAQKIPTKSYILSQVLNERLNRSFYDFINYYRIEEAKRILKSREKAHLKISFVGEEVGFNTTAVFYKAFKEYTGMTPKQYKKQTG